ncbi:MAG: hypothetical protein HZA54_19300 [Planctomycetes bacterium]|nr:hypothetical protein [Planctomycetota bacterium]
MFNAEEITFARRVVQKRWADEAMVRECMDLKQSRGGNGAAPRLWDLLVERGYLTADQAVALRPMARSER